MRKSRQRRRVQRRRKEACEEEGGEEEEKEKSRLSRPKVETGEENPAPIQQMRDTPRGEGGVVFKFADF